MTRRTFTFAGTSFVRVGAIRPERDGRGELIEVRPEPTEESSLHRYGEGPFCRFRIARESHWRRGGVYAVTCGDAVRYIGKCQDLAAIWNCLGRISPSAVRQEGGQQTHCRINALILKEIKQAVEVILWFHAVEHDVDRGLLKNRSVDALNPPWNLTLSASPIRSLYQMH